jgi:6-phosphogluconolactonase
MHVFWSDERCVAPDDARSNYHVARTSLLQHVPLPSGNIHRMPAELDQQQAAGKSSEDIRSFFARHPSASAFDLVLLGMGADGHIASLFPGDEKALLAEEPVIATRAPGGMPVEQRLSMSLPLLAGGRAVFFIVYGSDKKKVLDRVLAGAPDAQGCPAARFCARVGARWFVAP